MLDVLYMPKCFENSYGYHWRSLTLPVPFSDELYSYPLFVNKGDCNRFCQNLESNNIIPISPCSICGTIGMLGPNRHKQVCRNHSINSVIAAENYFIKETFEAIMLNSNIDYKDIGHNIFAAFLKDKNVGVRRYVMNDADDIREFCTLVEAIVYHEHWDSIYTIDKNLMPSDICYRFGLKNVDENRILDLVYDSVKYVNSPLVEDFEKIYTGNNIRRDLCRALSYSNFGNYEYDTATYQFVLTGLLREISHISLTKDQHDFIKKEVARAHNPFRDELIMCNADKTKYPKKLSKYVDKTLANLDIISSYTNPVI